MNSPETKSESIFSLHNLIVIGLVIFSCLILFFGNRLTEINSGIGAPDYLFSGLYAIWIVLVILSVALLFINVKKHFISDFLRDYFWGDKKLWGRTLFILTSLAIFYIFRFDAHLYGNGYIRVANFAQKSKPLFLWHDYGSTLLPYLIYQVVLIFGVAKVTAALSAYQIVSIFSGGVFIYFVFKISDLLYDNYNDKITSLFLILFSGLMLMFFGMVENYPILMVFAAAFYYQIIRFNKAGSTNRLLLLWFIALGGTIFHLEAITFVPVVLFLTVRYLFHGKKSGVMAGFITALAVILAALIFLYIKASNDIALENLILYLHGKSPEATYSLFSRFHLLEIFNLLFLYLPLFPVFIFALIIDVKDFKKDKAVPVLLIFMLAQLVYLWVLDPKNGMMREIPMFGFLLTATLFRGVYSLLKIRKRVHLARSTVMALCPAALVLMLPGIFIHLSPTQTNKSINDYLVYNDIKTKAALIALRDFYFEIGDMDSTNHYDQLVEKKTPGALKSRLVNDLYAHERYSEAFDYTNELVMQYPHNYVYRLQRAQLLKFYKKGDQARAEIDTAIMLAPYAIEPYHFLSEYYRESGLDAKSYEVLEKAVAFAPDNIIILTDLLTYYYKKADFRAVDSLSKVALEIDSLAPYPYMYLGLVAENYGRLDSALSLYTKFTTINDGLPDVPLIKKRMNEIYLRRKDSLQAK